jgi:hypothetical protein
MSRTVVTPLTTNRPSADERVFEMCAYISKSPGTIYFPVPSTILASAGTSVLRSGLTAEILSPRTRTVMCSSGDAGMTVMTVTFRIANVAGGCAPTLQQRTMAAHNARATNPPLIVKAFRRIGPPDTLFHIQNARGIGFVQTMIA